MTNIVVSGVNTEVLTRATLPQARVEAVQVEVLSRRTVPAARIESIYIEVLAPSIPVAVADTFIGWGIPRI